MKNLLALPLLLILLTGCPYDFPTATTTYDEAEKIDKKLFGKWTVFHEDNSFDEIRLSKGEKTVFHIQHDNFDEEGKKMEDHYYRGFSTDIKGTTIFNVEKKDGAYNYYKFKIQDDDHFTLWGVDEEYVKENFENAEGADAKEAREFLEENINDQKMYGDPLHFYREKSDKYEKKKAERK